MIKIDHLNKKYGRFTAVSDISIEFKQGRVSAIVGPNGSGKTTLIKCILGLARINAGEIYINNFKLNGNPEYRHKIGYMPQLARFPENLKVSELFSLILGLRGTANEIFHKLLEDFKIEKFWNKRIRSLSGGMRQKLSAVIALMFDPEILIMDEPTAGLDPISSQTLKSIIKEKRNQGRTIILTSHLMNELEELSDDIFFIFNGKTVYQGARDELLISTNTLNIESALARISEVVENGDL